VLGHAQVQDLAAEAVLSMAPFLLPAVWGLRLRVENADLSRKPILTYPLVSRCCEGRVHLDETVLQKRLGAVPHLRACLRKSSKFKNAAGPPQNTLHAKHTCALNGCPCSTS
jgi:hypothetical protein